MMLLLTNKDLAREMQCCVKTVFRRARRFNVKPTYCAQSGHRWSRARFQLLLLKWRKSLTK